MLIYRHKLKNCPLIKWSFNIVFGIRTFHIWFLLLFLPTFISSLIVNLININHIHVEWVCIMRSSDTQKIFKFWCVMLRNATYRFVYCIGNVCIQKKNLTVMVHMTLTRKKCSRRVILVSCKIKNNFSL